jgi:hypothetical protein
METPQTEDSTLGQSFSPPPLAHLYRLEEEDFGQNIWDWSEVLLGTPLVEHIGNLENISYWETKKHIENLLGTWKEHVGNKGKMKKN